MIKIFKHFYTAPSSLYKKFSIALSRQDFFPHLILPILLSKIPILTIPNLTYINGISFLTAIDIML